MSGALHGSVCFGRVAAEEVCEWGLGLHRRLARALTCPPSQRPGSFAFVCYIVVYVCLRTAICKAPWKGSANRFLDLDYRKLCWHQRQLPLVFALLFIIAIPGYTFAMYAYVNSPPSRPGAAVNVAPRHGGVCVRGWKVEKVGFGFRFLICGR